MLVDDVAAYLHLNPLNESAIRGLEYDPHARVAVLIYDYAAESVGRAFAGLPSTGIRDFRKLIFADVCRFSIAPARNGEASIALRDVQRHLVERSSVCVAGSELQRIGGNYILKLDLSDGILISIEFKTVNVETREGTAVSDGKGSWNYFDVKTGERIDFYHPFDWD